ncbi:Bax inhibitor-1/YccA family protein [Candidatus Pelagisphaera phototrophica]|uniref:Bax inhibitor-1/YccA family protein n=1 Tax=Candidatus Pelagisphaera phototrophica TaxID=2684113 RepID=UPI001A068E77|nr:Bax inhibitor-1/YccA family protein [Candidatus Pelagisphaera phototrophica]QXD31276.1 Bax inhibitor-1/YccA family protein [Candidatus Pelagisphaera phototrophica]
MRTSNPALNDKVFDLGRSTGNVMTINGTVNRTGILLCLLMFTAIFSWDRAYSAVDPGELYPWLIGSGIAGFVVALITVFKKTAAPITAPIYAAIEGILLGILSAFYEMQFPGLVFQAILLTFGTLFALLMAYRSGVIKATENFKLGVFAATGGIALIYLTTFILSFFGVSIPYIHGSGTIGILFSLFVVVIAALNLVLDFDFIERGAERGAPKYMEWYAAFGLLVTLIWLYMEMLRLLSKLRSR